MNRFRELVELYGPSAIPLFIFGSRTTQYMQAKVLGELKEGQNRPDDSRVVVFKSSTLAECNMVAVAAAVVAQMAMTGLSLKLSNQTYCLIKASFFLSLIFAILVVFHASCLQRTLNRLLTGEEIRRWIRGGSRETDAKTWGWPSISSVITASAPQMRLSISLAMLVLASGLYLGQFETAEPSGTKYAISVYIIELVLFVGAYSIAQSLGIEEVRSEIDIINGYMAERKENHPSRDTGDRRRPQTAQITTRTDENSEADPLLKQAETSGETSFPSTEITGRNSSTAPRSEKRCRDQAKDSLPPDLERGITEDSTSKNGSEASSRSKSSVKGKEMIGKEDLVTNKCIVNLSL
ncbi:hypothetical protein EAF00_003881 [Botryotinia globosa]|nr:hypothetical protein EAF00_003881 [Botryotinia globosa]